MGSCLGRCFPKPERRNRFYINRNRTSDFINLLEESTANNESKRSFIYHILPKRKNKTSKKPVLELVEGIFANPPGDSYSRLNESQCLPSSSSYNSRDIPLQHLDARALLAQTANSTPASSLDLEWEHEALPLPLNDPSSSSWVMVSREQMEEIAPTESSNQNGVGASHSDWSRVSSADSLEWDNVEDSFHGSPPVSDIDADTQQLLSEIEKLTSDALKETGRSLFS